MTPENEDSQRGRPRSEAATRAILAATIDVLAEEGYGALTMEGVAERAGVGKATLYRRWSGREALVRAAVEAFVQGVAIPNSGSVREDLEALGLEAAGLYRGKAGRLMAGLTGAMARSAPLAETVREEYLRCRRAALRRVLLRAMERSELREDADVELALDLLAGPLFYRLLVTGEPLDDGFVEGVVEVVLQGIAADADV